MRKWLSVLLAAFLLLPLLISCGETASPEGGSSEPVSSYHEDFPETDVPATDAEIDPFEGADPLPADLSFPDSVKLPDGTVVGTIVLPAGADADETLAAEELRLHIEKVTGANLPVVGRPGEEYGSLIVCTPASLPAISEWFADDIAWLRDLGSAESGSRFGSDGFAIRTAGKDVYIFGNTGRGALNGAYDLLEENFGILWILADEEEGTVFQPMPSVTVSVVNYREKSPFEYRGWDLNIPDPDAPSLPAARTLCSRNKENYVAADVADSVYLPIGTSAKSLLLSSPAYDPDETAYWPTDEEGTPLSAEEASAVNPWSEKTAEALAASVIEIMRTTGTRKVFLGLENTRSERFLPSDGEPFEYAPGQFVSPEDANYCTTVYHAMIGKIARAVREAVPDGMIGCWAQWRDAAPPACGIEDNVYVVYSLIGEDMCVPVCDQRIKEKHVADDLKLYCDRIVEWSEKTDNLIVYNYYGHSKIVAYAERALWNRMQTDLQDYVRLSVAGLSPKVVPDAEGTQFWFPDLGENACHRIWENNILTFWLYGKLAWNPCEDIGALIDAFCEKVYGPAAGSMREYYRLIQNSWDTVCETFPKVLEHDDNHSLYFREFIFETGIGHEVLDTLSRALEEADGPAKQIIEGLYESFKKNLNAIRGFKSAE